MEELRDDQLAQVGGGDAWNTLALVGGTVAAGVGGAFVAPAVAGSVFVAAGTYVVAYFFGSMWNKAFNRT
jgi:uncharacterized protein (DUF2062 family)